MTKEDLVPSSTSKMLEAKAFLIDVERQTGKSTQSVQKDLEGKLKQELQFLRKGLQKTHRCP